MKEVIINIKETYILEKFMQLWMRMRIVGHFEERQEDIVDDLLKMRHQLVQLENITAKKHQ